MENIRFSFKLNIALAGVIFILLSLKSMNINATVRNGNVTIDFSNCNNTFSGIGAAYTCSGDTVLISATPLNPGNTINYWEAVDSYGIPFVTGAGSNLILKGSIGDFQGFNFISNTTSCNISSGLTSVIASPSVDLGPNKQVCVGTVVTITNLSVTGASTYKYKWNTPLADSSNTFLVRSVPGIFYLSVTDDAVPNCNTTRVINVSNYPKPEVDAGGKKVRCFNQTLTLNAQTVVASPGTPPYTYQWSPNSNISGVTSKNPVIGNSSTIPQTYTVVLTDNNNCKATSSVTVTVNPAFNTNIPFSDTVVCKFNSIQLKNTESGGTPFTSGDPYKYSWTPAISLNDSTLREPIATSLSISGIMYILRVFDANNCVVKDSVRVRKSSLTMSFIPDVNSTNICTGTSTTLNVNAVNGDPPYTWTPGAQLSQVNSTSYITDVLTATTEIFIMVKDNKGCTDKDSIQILVDPFPQPNVGDKTANLCIGVSKNIDVTPLNAGTTTFSYAWSPNINISSIDVAAPLFTPTTSEGSQLYSVTVTSPAGCKGSDVITVSTRANPSVKIELVDKPLVNKPLKFSANGEGETFTWRFQDYAEIKTGKEVTQQFDSLKTYLINLSVTSIYGCIGTDSAFIQTISPTSGNIFIPNVFSPNSSDAKNKAFMVFGNKAEIVDTDFKVNIYNVFGERVFESNSFKQMNEIGWNGENFMPGIYSYVVKVKFTDDQSFTKTGTVTLLK